MSLLCLIPEAAPWDREDKPGSSPLHGWNWTEMLLSKASAEIRTEAFQLSSAQRVILGSLTLGDVG